MNISDLLKDLPSRNKENFTRIDLESQHRSANGKRSTYLTTKETQPEQIIVTERANIVLKFLHQQWDKKTNATKKRLGDPEQDEVPPKKSRLEPELGVDNSAPGPSSRSGSRPQSAQDNQESSRAGPSGPPPPYDPSAASRFTSLL